MKHISNNPYRIIGILAGTGLREKTKKISRLRMMVEAGVTEVDDFSFPNLGDLERSPETIDIAASCLDLDKDKLRAAIFWFCSVSHTDEPALDKLRENNIEETEAIWNKQTLSGNISKTNYSAYHNLSTLKLWKAFKEGDIDFESLRTGVLQKLKFFDSDYYSEIVKLSTDEYFSIKKNKLQEMFLSSIYEEGLKHGNGFEPEFWNILKDSKFSARSDFERKITGEIIEKIERSIAECYGARKQDMNNCIKAGNKLIEETKDGLLKIKKILGEDNVKYINLSDKVSVEASQCVFQYFKYYQDSDIDPGEESENLILKAKDSAIGKTTLENIEDNWKVINDWNKDRENRAKYMVVSKQIKQIENVLAGFREEEKSVDNAIELIKKCTPWLAFIGNEFGFNDSKYISLSTEIAREIQNYFVEVFNNTLEQWNNRQWTTTYATVKNTINRVYLGMANVYTLDMSQEFWNNTFSKNFDVIRDACRHSGIQTSQYGYRKISQTHKKKPPPKPMTKNQIIIRKVMKIAIVCLILLIIGLIIRGAVNEQKETKTKTENVESNLNKANEKFSKGNVVIIKTSLGVIKVGLYSNDVPITVSNFKNLINEGFYNSDSFDKLSDKSNVLMLGFSTKQFERDKEIKEIKHSKEGLLSVQKIGKNKASSQFIITLGPAPSYDGKYTIIGEVIEGIDITRSIGKETNISKGRDIKIENAEIE